MTTELLTYMTILAECKSLSEAAQICHISQPALSQSLKQMETELGTALFIRHRQGLTLTESGRIFLNNARAILFAEKQIQQTLMQLLEEQNRSVTLFVEEKFKGHFSRQVLGRFQALYPDVEISLMTGSTKDAEAYLHQNLASLAIFYIHNSFKKDFEYDILASLEYYLAVPCTHPCLALLQKNIRSLQKLSGETFILNSGKSEFKNFQTQIMERYQLYPDHILEVDNLTTVQHMLSRGYGIGFLPHPMPFYKENEYECLSLPDPFYYQFVLARRRDHILTPPESCLRDLTLQLLTIPSSSSEGSAPA